jgi:hypothetical protein
VKCLWLNFRYAFPETLDLSKFMTEDADKAAPPIYHLHGVLVHSGDVHGGHYYAFIRPSTKPEWFKFDDERVTRATVQQVTEDNFGGEEEYAYNLHGRKMTQVHALSTFFILGLFNRNHLFVIIERVQLYIQLDFIIFCRCTRNIRMRTCSCTCATAM